MAIAEAPISWDLSDLYAGPDDPALDGDCQATLEAAKAFEQQYRDRIARPDCDAGTLRRALDEYEALQRRRVRPLAYASLLFSADTTDPARGALLQKMQVRNTEIETHLIFFELEIGRMPEETFRRLVETPELAPYRHFLEHQRLLARHHLSEPEEKVLEEMSNTGRRAFARLFSEITSRAVFRVRIGDRIQEKTQSETLALLYDPNREVRRAAAEAITDCLKEQAHVLNFTFNTLLQDKATRDRLRGYEFPEQARYEEDQLPPEVVRTVVDTCVESYGIVADYYRMKRRLLDLDELTHYDRYAPIGELGTRIPFGEAREIVLDSFGRFSPVFRELAEPFFSRRWIDAEVRPGKRGGAFCSYVSPDLHPYVLMNYTERVRDVMTLAHELGHALHGLLAARQHFLDFYPPLPMAETASVFAEMLVFDRLRRELPRPEDRLALLCSRIEDSFATVFRQVAMFRFEQAAHRLRREEGEQPVYRYNELWQLRMQEMFGDSLRLGDDHGWWWLYIPHIYSTPFYVYAYAFGELLVLSLYGRYRQEGEPFVERYLELLASGGSAAPDAMLARMGIDVRERAFWQGGIELLRGMVDEARALAGP